MSSTDTRRTFLYKTGVAFIALLAGCSSPENSPPPGDLVISNDDTEPHTVTITATHSILSYNRTKTRTVSLAASGGTEDLSELIAVGTVHLHVRTDTGAIAEKTIRGSIPSYAVYVISVASESVDIAYYEK